MFKLSPPEVHAVLKGSSFLPDLPPGIQKDKIVVVSVVGTSGSRASYSGYKRAFRLALDGFGKVGLFKKEEEEEEEEENNLDFSAVFAPEDRSKSTTPEVPPNGSDEEDGPGLERKGGEINIDAGVVRSQEADAEKVCGTEECSQGGNDQQEERTEFTEEPGTEDQRDPDLRFVESDELALVHENGSQEKDIEEVPPAEDQAELEQEERQDSNVSEPMDDGDVDVAPEPEEKLKVSQDVLKSCFIDGFYSRTDSVLFLHLCGVEDPHQLLAAAEEMKQIIETMGFMHAWTTAKTVYCRYLLLVFFVSHIVIFSEVRSSFDASYIQLFRILDSVRLSLRSVLRRALEKETSLPKDWIYHGRICSPRVLFLFEVETDACTSVSSAGELHSSAMEKMKLDMEDEIYHILRKCRIITNISSNSLFSLPGEESYLFLFNKKAHGVDSVDLKPQALYHKIVNDICKNVLKTPLEFDAYEDGDDQECSDTEDFDLFALRPKNVIPPVYGSSSEYSVKNYYRPSPSIMTYSDLVNKFRSFLLGHTKLAHTHGFCDDSKRVSEYKKFFVIPTFAQWKTGYQVLLDALFNTDTTTQTGGFDQLNKFINVESEYLNNQCATMFPKIYAVYQRGLPEFYSETTHRLRLTQAMNAYLTISRGAGIIPWLNKLAEKCEQYWRKGHQRCEVLSLFQRQCVNQCHRVLPEDNLELCTPLILDKEFPEMKHNAGARIIAYCNCGRKQGIRDEPFCIREANYGFYQRMAKECCDRLEKILFPVFSPPDSEKEMPVEELMKMLKIRSKKRTRSGKDEGNKFSQELEVDKEGSDQMMEMDLRQDAEASGDESFSPDANDEGDETAEAKLCPEDDSAPVVEADASAPSETAYLPMMVNSKSPKGILPKFSSWSLVRLGLSSLYNHSSGMSPRSTFLSGANFLLPWDVVVKAEAGVAKPVPRMIRGRRAVKPKPITDEFSVKVFYGLEYECQRGHRFIGNDTEKVVNFSLGNAGLKEVASKLIGTDMPLYYKCPCKESRDGRTVLAQLMRIHVVTPKAPVHCFVSPKVQPAPPPCPTFFPEIMEPIKLSTSSYWTLRLPYCYVGDEVYGPPKQTDSTFAAKILKECLSVSAMTPEETKIWEKDNL